MTQVSPPTMLSDDERADCAVCADLLATGPYWLMVSAFSGLALLAANLSDRASTALWPVALLLVAAQTYVAARVALDARLFARLARGEASGLATLAQLDGALERVLSVSNARGPRPVADRVRGARRLYLGLLVCSSAMALVAVGSWLGALLLAWGQP